MSEKSLLEQARELSVAPQKIAEIPDRDELLIAWLVGDVSTKSVTAVSGIAPGSISSYSAFALRRMLKSGAYKLVRQ